MDIESVGAGAGGGFFTALLAWLGVKQRFDRIDADIKYLQDKTVWRDTCHVTNQALQQRLASMESKIDKLLEKL